MTTFFNAAGEFQTGLVALNSAGQPETIALTQDYQVAGTNGAGSPAAMLLEAGSGIALDQSANILTISAPSGAVNWSATPQNNGTSNSFTIPIGQTITSLASGLPFSPTSVPIFSGYQQQIASVSTTNTAMFNINFATDIRLNNSPTMVVFCIYGGTSSVSPTTGSAPLITYPYLLPTQAVTSGAYVQYIVRIKVPLSAQATSYYLTLVPYIYVPSGSALGGTNIIGGSSSITSFYTTEGGVYAQIAPLVSQQIETDSIALDVLQGATAIANGSVSTASTKLFSGQLLSFGEPSYTTFKVSIPIFMSGFGSVGTVTISVVVYIGGFAYQQASKTFYVSGYPYVFDEVTFQLPLNSVPANEEVAIYIAYQTNTSATITCYTSSAGASTAYSPPISAVYNSKLTQFSAATGSLTVSDQRVVAGVIGSSTKSLPTTVTNLVYTPPTGGIPATLSTAHLVDTQLIPEEFAQSACDITFNFTYISDAHSTAPLTDLPIILVVLALTNSDGSTVYSTISKAHKSIPTSWTVQYIDTISVTGRVNILSSPSYVSAYAFICSQVSASNVTATVFETFNSSSGAAWAGAGSNWVINTQALLGVGGSSSVGVSSITPAGSSYLTASETAGAVTIGTQQATTAQAGILATTDIGAAGQYATLTPSGTTWTTMPSFLQSLSAQINSYLTASTVSGAATISTTLASTSQGGLLAAPSAGTLGQYATLGSSGVTWATLPSSITSVAAQSGSYLTATTASGATTISTTQASSSQGGLLSIASAYPANTLFRVNSAGQLVAATVPYYPTFGSSLALAFGGASVGVTYTSRQGVAVNMSSTYVPIAASGSASNEYSIMVEIKMVISSKGTSTGSATITGIPVIPNFAGGGTLDLIVTRATGISRTNNTVLGLQYSSGSSTLTFVTYPTSGGASTTLTNTAFTAPITVQAFGFVPTTTPPPN